MYSMEHKKRFLSLALALVLCLALVPMTAFAADSDFNSIIITSGSSQTEVVSMGSIKTSSGAGWSFSGSTLTLDNFTGNSIKVEVSSTTNENSARGIPFTIQLNGTNTLNQSANAYAIAVNYANLIISGPGTLNINSEYDGVTVFGKSIARDQYKGGYITVQNGAVVNVKTKAAGVTGTSELYVDATSTLTVETTNAARATSPVSAVGYIPTVRVDGTLKAKTTEGGKKAIDASNYIAGGGVAFRYGDSEDALLTIGDSSKQEIMGGTIAMDSAYQKPYMEFVGGGGAVKPPNPPTPPTPTLTATPTASTVLVNGTNVAFDAYNIGGNNYFKLRDLAFTLNGTAKQFAVTYDNATGQIGLSSGEAYTAVGGEMTGKGAGNKTPTPTASTIFVDGVETEFTAYNIEGNNYFKLRDIGEVFDFEIDWDGARNTIVIDTSKGYTPD